MAKAGMQSFFLWNLSQFTFWSRTIWRPRTLLLKPRLLYTY